MARCWFSVAVYLTTILIVAVPPSNAAEPPPEGKAAPTLSEIAAAWKARQARIHSAEFEWEEVRVMSRGPTDLKRGPFDPPPGMEPKGTVTDRQTYRHTYRSSLLFEGEKTCFVDGEPSPTLDRTGFVDSEITQAFDGSHFQHLHRMELPGQFPSQGAVYPRAQSAQFALHSVIALQPLLVHFRPFRDDGRFVAGFKVLGQHGVVDGTRCVVLERVEHPTENMVESLWVDPEEEFCVRRIARRAGGVVLRQFDVFYRADPQYGPIPRGWKLVEHMRNGEFDMSVEATVLTGKVNQDVPDDRFRLEFPVNTLVYDYSNSMDEPVQYIVRPGGERRIVLAEEMARAKSADELINSETGLAGIEQPHQSRLPTVLATGVLGALAAMIVWLSVRRMRAH